MGVFQFVSASVFECVCVFVLLFVYVISLCDISCPVDTSRAGVQEITHIGVCVCWRICVCESLHVSEGVGFRGCCCLRPTKVIRVGIRKTFFWIPSLIYGIKGVLVLHRSPTALSG